MANKKDVDKRKDDCLDLLKTVKNLTIVVAVLLCVLICVVGFRTFCLCC